MNYSTRIKPITVDQVLAPFHKAMADLEQVATYQREESEAAASRIYKAQTKADQIAEEDGLIANAAIKEARRADKIMLQLINLVSSDTPAVAHKAA